MGESPLVVIGEVVAVEKLKDNRPEDARRGAGPSAARVKVLEILKGHPPGKELRIGSGPVESCSPEDRHYSFHVGRKEIFILPRDYGLSQINFRFGGCMLGLDARPIVEARLHRARAFRDDTLDRLGREDPAARAEGAALAEEMRRESGRWPAPKWDSHEGFSAEFKRARDALVERLRKSRVEAIIAALALDWLGDETWWRHELWERAVDEIGRERAAEIKRAERKRIREALRLAWVPDETADRYAASLDRRELGSRIHFPPYADPLQDRSDPERVTTEFILLFHEYDRGSMFTAYGMDFDALEKLDPGRVETLLPALYGSDDEQLKVVAFRAIERIPGTRFVGMVLDRLMESDRAAWRALVHPKEEKETKARLEALCDAAERRYDPYWLRYFWIMLQDSRCFENGVIERALGRLESADEETATTLRKYLSAAMEDRDPKKLPVTIPEEGYRAWFRDHPRRARER